MRRNNEDIYCFSYNGVMRDFCLSTSRFMQINKKVSSIFIRQVTMPDCKKRIADKWTDTYFYRDAWMHPKTDYSFV